MEKKLIEDDHLQLSPLHRFRCRIANMAAGGACIRCLWADMDGCCSRQGCHDPENENHLRSEPSYAGMVAGMLR